MKKIRIGKECNSNGRLKKSSRKELTMIKKKSVPILHNSDNDERRKKKEAQKIAAQKRATKRKKIINKFYLVNIKHKYNMMYLCGCTECESSEYGKRVKYASSAEEAVMQVINLEFEDYIDYDFFDYHDDYYDGYVDRCVDLEIHTGMEFTDDKCPHCSRDSYMVLIPGHNIKYNIDNLFNKYVYCHGVYAFNTGGNELMIIERIRKIFSNNNMSICCSWKTQPIGPVGVYVNGKITLASNTDVSSYIIHDGIRCFKDINSIKNGKSQIIGSPLELDFTIHNHCEFFMENPKVVGIWIKKWFVENESTDRFILEKIYEIGKKNGIPIYIIGNRRNK